MTHVLTNYLLSTGKLSMEEISFSVQFFKPTYLKKGDFFIREDEPCRHVGFIASGAVKAYALDREGKENITCFKFENEFATSFPEFVAQKESRRSIRAIEDSVICSISYADYYYLLLQVIAWNGVVKSLMEREYSQKESYLLNYNNRSALDKYRRVLSSEPMLIQRVATQDLASYLGITQRSLTRAKQQIFRLGILGQMSFYSSVLQCRFVQKIMLRQIAPEVFQLSLLPRNSINCYIIEGVLVDSGIRNSYSTIKKTLQEIPVYQHILTHAHPDHQGCSGQLCAEFAIPLLCHPDEVFRTETGLVTKDYPDRNHWLAKLQQKYWSGQGHRVNRTVVEKDMIGSFQVIETPGHSAGHISLFREYDGVLIIGDAATNMNLLTTKSGLHLPPNLFTSDQQLNMRSLQKLAKLNPAIICFGHGPVMTNTGRKFERFVAECSSKFSLRGKVSLNPD